MNIYDKGLVTILGVSTLLIVVAMPLALRRVPRNILYGFRTRATMANDEIWYDANAYFGRALIISTLCGALVACVIYLVQPFPPAAFLPASILLLAAPALIVTVATFRHTRSLASCTGSNSSGHDSDHQH
ncbi:MAG: SdpI family protein [Casimicrobiaceae bacterium]